MNLLTDIPEIDTEILKVLKNQDLYQACQINKYAFELCYNDKILKYRFIEEKNKYIKSYEKANDIIIDLENLMKEDEEPIEINLPHIKDLIHYEYLFPKEIVEEFNHGDLVVFGMNGSFNISYTDEKGGFAIMMDKEKLINLIAIHIYEYPNIDINLY